MVEINDYFCPNENCKCYGLRGQGNLVKADKYRKDGVARQMFKCKICQHRFSETRNTIFFRSRYSDTTVHSIIRSVAEGNGVRTTVRMPGLSRDGVNSVILTVGAYAETVMDSLLKNLHLNECQMDELWSFVNKKTLDEEELAKGYGTKWIWTAFSPENRLIICYLIGGRTLENCRAYFKKLLSRVSNKPLFTSDEPVHYKTVLMKNFSTGEPACPTGNVVVPVKAIEL